MDRILLLGRDGWMVVCKLVLHGPLRGGPQADRFKWRNPANFRAIYFRPPQPQSTGSGTNTQNIKMTFFGKNNHGIESTDPLSRRGSSTLFLVWM